MRSFNHSSTASPRSRITDLADENDQVVKRGTKEEAIRRSLWRRAVHAFVFNRKGELFLWKRPLTAPTYPGLYTSSAGGHVEVGQIYWLAAVEELKEELGIRGRLINLDRFKGVDSRGKDFHHLFVCVAKPWDLKPNPSEARSGMLSVRPFGRRRQTAPARECRKQPRRPEQFQGQASGQIVHSVRP